MREALVDANILLRYLTDEPPELAERAFALLEAAERATLPLIVTPMILAEVVYVLESVYEWSRQDIANGLLSLIDASVLLFLEEHVLSGALILYRDVRQLDIADAYLAALAKSRGESAVLSFDRDLRRIVDLTVIHHPDQLPSPN
jgi:predicted nucleic acid-binding protein